MRMEDTQEKTAAEGNRKGIRHLCRFAAGLALVLLIAFGTACAAMAADADTYNLLLIGSDRRDSSWNGNSDVMILITVNHDKQTIFMTSFMRDLYAEVPGYGVSKLNAAYAVGGASLLQQTLENMYGVTIDNYMCVDFKGMANIIDRLGGVDIEQSDAEAEVTNRIIQAMCDMWGMDAGQYYTSGGLNHFNGIQAVGYMRDRYVGYYDYERTERQRRVLSQIFHSVDTTDSAQLMSLALDVLKEADHDITTLELASLLKMVPEAAGYDLETGRIPYDDLYSSSGEMLVPDFGATRERLLGTIYASE